VETFFCKYVAKNIAIYLEDVIRRLKSLYGGQQ
jgi:hypothetical protein